jgi:hypothetical protein
MSNLINTLQIMNSIAEVQGRKDASITMSYQNKSDAILKRLNRLSDIGLETLEDFEKAEYKINLNYKKMSLALAENKYAALVKAQTFIEGKVVAIGRDPSVPYLLNMLEEKRNEIEEVRQEINSLKKEIRETDKSPVNQLRIAFINAKENAIAAGQKCISWGIDKISELGKKGSELGNSIGRKSTMISLSIDKFMTNTSYALEKFHNKVLGAISNGINNHLIAISEKRMTRLEEMKNRIDKVTANINDKEAEPIYSNMEIITGRYMAKADKEELKIEEYADRQVEEISNERFLAITDIPQDMIRDEDIYGEITPVSDDTINEEYDSLIQEMDRYEPEYNDSPFKYGVGTTLASEIMRTDNEPVNEKQWDEFLSRVQTAAPRTAITNEAPAPEKLSMEDFGNDNDKRMIDPKEAIRKAKEKINTEKTDEIRDNRKHDER